MAISFKTYSVLAAATQMASPAFVRRAGHAGTDATMTLAERCTR
jgi:hypothetical protein